MNLQTIETSESNEDGMDEKTLQKYFNDSDLFQLFSFNETDECETLNLIMSRDGFKYQ